MLSEKQIRALLQKELDKFEVIDFQDNASKDENEFDIRVTVRRIKDEDENEENTTSAITTAPAPEWLPGANIH